MIPRDGGLAVARRAALIAAFTWLPLVAWAIATGRALGHSVEHFGVHVRSLGAIPLLVLADATTHATLSRVAPYFSTSGLLDESARLRYEALLSAATALGVLEP